MFQVSTKKKIYNEIRTFSIKLFAWWILKIPLFIFWKSFELIGVINLKPRLQSFSTRDSIQCYVFWQFLPFANSLLEAVPYNKQRKRKQKKKQKTKINWKKKKRKEKKTNVPNENLALLGKGTKCNCNEPAGVCTNSRQWVKLFCKNTQKSSDLVIIWIPVCGSLRYNFKTTLNGIYITIGLNRHSHRVPDENIKTKCFKCFFLRFQIVFFSFRDIIFKLIQIDLFGSFSRKF